MTVPFFYFRRRDSIRAAFCTLLIGGTLFTLAGCGRSKSDRPDLALVHGVLKLNGLPVEGALVTFVPEKGRPSSGISNTDGHYELQYHQNSPGAALGHHQVRIHMTDRSESGIAFKEIFEPKFNSQSELTADVKPGDNTIDFLLESKASMSRHDRPALPLSDASPATGKQTGHSIRE